MEHIGIQFWKGLSLPEFQRLYGSEEPCEAALERARWPDGFRSPRCSSHEHGLIYGRRLKRDPCRSCGHQATHGEGSQDCGGLSVIDKALVTLPLCDTCSLLGHGLDPISHHGAPRLLPRAAQS